MAEDELSKQARERIGALIDGKYRLEAVLGVGGMAAVYRATHRNQTEVALKMLHPEMSRRVDVRARFLREAYAGNSVKHPGVVRVLDDDTTDDGAAYLVMELLEGSSVETIWERNGFRLPPAGVIAIGHQLLDVLVAAHEKGVVHRDLKPANLFVTKEGRLKVLDFGIARARDGEALTMMGVRIGTPAFMPPEQALGREVDGRTDLWAVAATLFTLLTGRTVHSAETEHEFLCTIATKPVPPLAAIAPTIPQELATILERALAFEREARWQTASEMRNALDDASKLLLGRPADQAIDLAPKNVERVPCAPTVVMAPQARAPLPATVSMRAQSRKRTRKRPLIVAGAVLALALAGGGVALGLPRTTPPPEAPPSPHASTSASTNDPKKHVPFATHEEHPVQPVDCSDPFYVDAHRVKHWKPECINPTSKVSKAKLGCSPPFWIDPLGAKHVKPECP